MDLVPGIRNCVRAVILKGGQVLLLRKVYENGTERFVLPGGAQDAGETLGAALQRECLEEIGCEVTVKGLLYVADFFKPRSRSPGAFRQQVEYLFQCAVPNQYTARNGSRPDKHQTSVDWVSIRQLSSIEIFPACITELLSTDNLAAHPIYLGEISA